MPYEIGLFAGKSDLKAVIESLERAVTYEVFPEMLEQISHDIPVIKNNLLRLYNRKTLQLTQLTLNQRTKIDTHSSYCYITDDTLLCCGGSQSNEVYEVNIRTGIVKRMPNMNYPRWIAGIWNYQGKCIYVFGGKNGDYSNDGEKYKLATNVWTNLPNPMQTTKYCCTVCEHVSGLYISGCESAGISVEHFDPLNETFKMILTDTLRFVPIICCLRDELYLIRANTIEQASLANGPTEVKFTLKATTSGLGLSHYRCFCAMKFVKGELIGGISSVGAPSVVCCFNPAKLQCSTAIAFTY